MMHTILKYLLVAVTLLLSGVVYGQTRVILDTDLDSDVDDVQALAMLHAYRRLGLVNLLGVVVTSNDSSAAACADAINTFYGAPDLPIGFLKQQNGLRHFSRYTQQISREFPHSLKSIAQTTESAQLYRQLLAASPDSSVVIITIGHLTSLQYLLQSPPDSLSSLDGLALVRQKVKRWFCMGGQFPQGKEANFYRPDPAATVYCLEHWPQQVVFCGWEVGHQITTGSNYLKQNLPQDHPVHRAYALYNDFAGRPAWDQVAILWLDDRAEQYFTLVRDGYAVAKDDGSNIWKKTIRADRQHAYVRLRQDVIPDSVARYMDHLVIAQTQDSNSSLKRMTHVQEGRYTIALGPVRMTIDARRGGRICSLAWQEQELLLQEREELLNFGSTFWTAPQSAWGWPPYEALHQGSYRAALAGDSLVLTGEVDTSSGFRAIKTVRLDQQAQAFDLTYTLVNSNDTARKVGPWEVTAVPAGGLTFFRQRTKPLPASTLALHDTLGICFFSYLSAKPGEKRKIFAFSQGGWLAHVTEHRYVLVKKFEPVTPARVAPGQGEVELYVDPQRGYIELENHGAYQKLLPGERLDYRVKWFLRKLPPDIPADRVTQALIHLVEHEILSATTSFTNTKTP